jgi:hypothetical protein
VAELAECDGLEIQGGHSQRGTAIAPLFGSGKRNSHGYAEFCARRGSTIAVSAPIT